MVCVPSVKRDFSPLDEELELVAGHFTPSVYEGVTRLASWMPFGQAAKEAGYFVHVTLSEATVRRQSEAVGAAYVALQTREVERIEKGESPKADAGVHQQFLSVDGAFVPLVGGEWAEVKTLVIGTVEPAREVKGEMVVKTGDLTYFSRLAEASTFQRLALVETHRRGLNQSEAVGAVTDGSEWCQGFIDYHRPDAVRILDFPHAAEYVATISQTAFAQNETTAKTWLTEQLHQLKHDGPLPVLAAAQLLAYTVPDQPELAKALAYLLKRQDHMAYPLFQADGWPIGDGAVESANKLVVEARLKGSGMHWAPAHVNPMLALRNIACNDRWSEAWPLICAELRRQTAQRSAARAQRRHARSHPASPPLCTPPQPATPRPSPLPTRSLPAQPAPADLPKTPYRPPASHPWRQPFLLSTKRQTAHTKPC